MAVEIKEFRFRDNTRAPFETEVRLRFDRFGGNVAAYSADVSMEGMFVRTDEPKPVGTLVQFEFQLGGQEDLIQGLGDVVWLREDETTSGKPSGMGVQFRYLDPQSRDRIYKIVRHFLEEKKQQADSDESLEALSDVAEGVALAAEPPSEVETPPARAPQPETPQLEAPQSEAPQSEAPEPETRESGPLKVTRVRSVEFAGEVGLLPPISSELGALDDAIEEGGQPSGTDPSAQLDESRGDVGLGAPGENDRAAMGAADRPIGERMEELSLEPSPIVPPKKEEPLMPVPSVLVEPLPAIGADTEGIETESAILPSTVASAAFEASPVAPQAPPDVNLLGV